MDNPDAGEVIEAYTRFGVDIPEALIPPSLADVELYYWDAFWNLSTERQATMNGSGPIPWLKIRAYASIAQVGHVNEFCAIIRAMDSVYLGYKKPLDKHTMRGG